ncbi:MAG: TolC family protein [Dysgonamonadaceae bacterium]|jgi:outer membrane protein TolC|nr:TolC family protein [Dysgonamonadaceae bacterium]
MKRFSCILFLLLFVISAIDAQRKITFDEAISIALSESHTVHYYKEDMEATRYSYLYTQAQFKPFLDFDLFIPSWEEGVQEIYQANGLPVYNSTGSVKAGGNLSFKYVLPTGGNFDLSSNMYYENYRTTLFMQNNEVLKQNQVYSRFMLSFNQPIFTANKLKENMKVAELDYLRSIHYYTRAQMDIVYNVTSAFYQVYRTAFENKINQDRLTNSKEAFRIAKLKMETGNLPEGELLTAEIVVGQDESRLMESHGKLEAAYDDFKLLIGLNLNDSIELVADMEFESFLIDRQKAIDEAIQNRLEIQENDINIQLQQIEIKRAKREREVKGNISAYYNFTGLSTLEDGTLRDLTRSSFENMFDRPSNRGIVFTLSYPIADWGRSKNLLRREERRLQQQKLELEDTKRTIETQVRKIVRNVYEADKRFRINQRNRDAAVESYRISRLRFENGDMTGRELSIEQERLSQIQLAYIDAYITYRLSIADLNRKTMYDFENNRSYLIGN